MDLLKSAQKNNLTSTTMPSEKLAEYDLGGVDCQRCGNTGQIIEQGPGLLEIHVYECPCMKHRRSLRSLRKAGMENMAVRYTFDSYQTDTPHREKIKHLARDFVKADSGWFFIAGQSGSGKTHICTAICTGLMEERASEIYFMPWIDEAKEIKSRIRDAEWSQAKSKKLKTVPVLYIDDFGKGGLNDADLKLAFEILNARYNNTALRTIISCEMPIDDILRADEALGGRIYERSQGFIVRAPVENWRLK